MQTDVAEVFEPAGEGRGGSSTMPHKRNPVSPAIVLSAVRVPALVGNVFSAMVQEPRITAHLSYEELNRLLDPVNYTGVADAPIERVLAAALAGN
ncbi:lyase family protein [Pseudogulbenkiania sp. MAI-1]|uniref:lyase family protein n=1 Tax=Pseudogulbenkiania sp. MAI-1 TaxID=990370 RepID=UPI00045E5D95|nr:lyase family protein [Pseudogulbenkiania sp. MAI-1]